MSDQQKGLASALVEVLPGAEHRNYIQHLYSNFKKKHQGKELKTRLWNIANAITQEQYELELESLKEYDDEAHAWIKNVPPPRHWVKSFFPLHTKYDTLVNNMCESFNSKILEAREKLIISMLEDIRVYIMTKIERRV